MISHSSFVVWLWLTVLLSASQTNDGTSVCLTYESDDFDKSCASYESDDSEKTCVSYNSAGDADCLMEYYQYEGNENLTNVSHLMQIVLDVLHSSLIDELFKIRLVHQCVACIVQCGRICDLEDTQQNENSFWNIMNIMTMVRNNNGRKRAASSGVFIRHLCRICLVTESHMIVGAISEYMFSKRMTIFRPFNVQQTYDIYRRMDTLHESRNLSDDKWMALYMELFRFSHCKFRLYVAVPCCLHNDVVRNLIQHGSVPQCCIWLVREARKSKKITINDFLAHKHEVGEMHDRLVLYKVMLALNITQSKLDWYIQDYHDRLQRHRSLHLASLHKLFILMFGRPPYFFNST